MFRAGQDLEQFHVGALRLQFLLQTWKSMTALLRGASTWVFGRLVPLAPCAIAPVAFRVMHIAGWIMRAQGLLETRCWH